MSDIRPLSGIRVVELATVMMAPYASQILGDLGADIVKVEPPTGDTSRYMADGPHPQLSGISLNMHRNKRSIVLDLKRPEPLAALRRLIEQADVVVTNLMPAALEEFGIAYHHFESSHPRLIYCEAHGFRTDSPEADEPALDDTISSLTGIPGLFADQGLETRFPPMLVSDKVAGLTIVYGVTTALFERERSGKGQRIEVPMFDTILAFTLAEHLARAAVPGQKPGYDRLLTLNRGPHETSDGWLAVMPYTNRQWQALYSATGNEELLENPWHADMQTRLVRAEEAYGELKTIIRQRTTDEWIQLCRRESIPVARVNRLHEIVDDPSLHRGVLRETEHPHGGRYRQIAPPVRFSRTPLAEIAGHAPLLDENGAEILAEAGFSPEEITLIQGTPK
jgi:crotonobetainyl-CoA:carnitine CoA-transferase CaiB-like acyl-CoA transferase